jgi:hypothetical protein
MKNGLLMTVAFLVLSYSQTGSAVTLMAYLSAPTELTRPDSAGEHGISAPCQKMLNNGIRIAFAHARLQAGERQARCGSNTSLTLTGNSKTYEALGELWLSGSGSKADSPIMLRASDSGASSPDADVLPGSAAVNGLNATSTTSDPGSLLMAGSVLIAIGATMKKMRKKDLASTLSQRRRHSTAEPAA